MSSGRATPILVGPSTASATMITAINNANGAGVAVDETRTGGGNGKAPPSRDDTPTGPLALGVNASPATAAATAVVAAAVSAADKQLSTATPIAAATPTAAAAAAAAAKANAGAGMSGSDAAGVKTRTASASASERERKSRSCAPSKLQTCVMFLVGIGLAVIVMLVFYAREQVTARDGVVSVCQSQAIAVQKETTSALRKVEALSAFLVALGGPNADGPLLSTSALTTFARTLPIAGDGSTPTFQLSWNQRILHADRDAWEARTGIELSQRIYDAQYAAGGPPPPPEKETYLNVSSPLHRSPNNTDYYAVILLYPVINPAVNNRIFDEGSNRYFRNAFQRAIDEARITDVLVRSSFPYPTARTSLIEFRPQYVNNSFDEMRAMPTNATTIALRRSRCVGLSQSIINPQTMLTLALTGAANNDDAKRMYMQLSDNTVPASSIVDQAIFATVFGATGTPTDVSLNDDYSATVPVPLGGRSWSLTCRPHSALIASKFSIFPWLLGSGVFLVFSLTCTLMLVANFRLQEVEGLLSEVERARDVALRATHTKTNFLSFLCHEVRNSLHAIISMTDAVLNTPGSALLVGAGGGAAAAAAAAAAAGRGVNPSPPARATNASTSSGSSPAMAVITSSPSADSGVGSSSAGGAVGAAAMDDAAAAATREQISAIQEASQLIQNVVNDALDVSKMDSGIFEFEHSPFDLLDSIHGIVRMHQPVAAQRGLNLMLEAGAEGEPTEVPAVVFGDPTRVRQLVTHSLTNAVKFTNRGSVTVSVQLLNRLPSPLRPSTPLTGATSAGKNSGANMTSKATRSPLPAIRGSPAPASNAARVESIRAAAAGMGDANANANANAAGTTTLTISDDRTPIMAFESTVASNPPPATERKFVRRLIEIKIVDTGVGFPEHVLPTLFDSYSPARMALAREFGGTGLGLSIVHTILKGMHGRISLDTRTDIGTTITIEIPFEIPVDAMPILRATIGGSPPKKQRYVMKTSPQSIPVGDELALAAALNNANQPNATHASSIAMTVLRPNETGALPATVPSVAPAVSRAPLMSLNSETELLQAIVPVSGGASGSTSPTAIPTSLAATATATAIAAGVADHKSDVPSATTPSVPPPPPAIAQVDIVPHPGMAVLVAPAPAIVAAITTPAVLPAPVAPGTVVAASATVDGATITTTVLSSVESNPTLDAGATRLARTTTTLPPVRVPTPTQRTSTGFGSGSVTPAGIGAGGDFKRPGSGTRAAVGAERPRVLLVEDHVVNQKIVMRMLITRVDLDIAVNGAEAIQKVQEVAAAVTAAGAVGAAAGGPPVPPPQPYRLILMDINMPVLTGDKATIRLRELGCAIPIVGLTANAMRDDVDRYLSIGMNQVITKPFKADTLLAAVKQYTGAGPGTGTGSGGSSGGESVRARFGAGGVTASQLGPLPLITSRPAAATATATVAVTGTGSEPALPLASSSGMVTVVRTTPHGSPNPSTALPGAV